MEKINSLRSKGYTYLVHTSKRENLEGILSTTQVINTLYERYQNGLNPKGVYSCTEQDLTKPFELGPYEYPGIFFHLVSITLEELYEKNKENEEGVLMVFPLELMMQRNWHYKIMDKNGLIDYDTYFYENMEDIPTKKEIKEYYESKMECYVGNEVVFHDGIHMSNCIKVIGKNLEENPIPYELKLDLDKKPNYIYYSDRRYDGTKSTYFNPLYRDLTVTKDEYYINFMREHLPEEYKYLCENVETKEEMENRIYNIKIDNMDLYTYLYVNR